MKLVAEIITGSLFHVEVGKDATVADLKKQIWNQEKLPRDRLILMLDAQERYVMEKDEAPLRDCGVKESSHIYIFFQPLNDASSERSASVDEKADENEGTDYEQGLPPNEPSNASNEPSSSVHLSSAQSQE